MREKDGVPREPDRSAWSRRARAAWFWTKAVAFNSTLLGDPRLPHYAPDACVGGFVWKWVALVAASTWSVAFAFGLESRLVLGVVAIASHGVPLLLLHVGLLAALALPGGEHWMRRAEASFLLDDAERCARAEDGRDVAERALALDPRSIRGHLTLARACATLGDDTEVAVHLHAAVRELGVAIAQKAGRAVDTTRETHLLHAARDWLARVERRAAGRVP